MIIIEETGMERSLAFTALLSLDPAFERLDMKKSEPYIIALTEAWLAQEEEKNLWKFAERWLSPRTRCDTIGCDYHAIVTITWSMPDARTIREKNYVCRDCAAHYASRPSLQVEIADGARPWHNMLF